MPKMATRKDKRLESKKRKAAAFLQLIADTGEVCSKIVYQRYFSSNIFHNSFVIKQSDTQMKTPIPN